MDKHMSHADHLVPWDLRMSLPELLRQAVCSFADDLQVMNDPYLKQLVGLKSSLVTCGSIPFDLLGSLQDVEQPLAVASHNGIASRSTRSRMRGRNPFSVTTSTSTPRNACRS